MPMKSGDPREMLQFSTGRPTPYLLEHEFQWEQYLAVASGEAPFAQMSSGDINVQWYVANDTVFQYYRYKRDNWRPWWLGKQASSIGNNCY